MAEIDLQVTVNDKNPRVPIEIFEGRYDDPNRNWIVRDTISTNYGFYEVPVKLDATKPEDSNRRWQVAATYKVGEKTVVVFDDAEVRWLIDDKCEFDGTCHIAIGGFALLLLKGE